MVTPHGKLVETEETGFIELSYTWWNLENLEGYGAFMMVVA